MKTIRLVLPFLLAAASSAAFAAGETVVPVCERTAPVAEFIVKQINVQQGAQKTCADITAEDLHLTPLAEESDAAMPPGEKWPLQDYLDRVERAAINEALEKTRYNRTAAAKLLGITFRAMRYRMERLGIK